MPGRTFRAAVSLIPRRDNSRTRGVPRRLSLTAQIRHRGRHGAVGVDGERQQDQQRARVGVGPETGEQSAEGLAEDPVIERQHGAGHQEDRDVRVSSGPRPIMKERMPQATATELPPLPMPLATDSWMCGQPAGLAR